MTKFITIVALDFAEITCLVQTTFLPILFLNCTDIYLLDINPSNSMGFCLLSLIPTIATAIFFLIFMGFFGSFSLVPRSSSLLNPEFLSPSLWFIGMRIFHSSALTIVLSSCRTTTLGKILICIMSKKAESKSSLGLAGNRFFNYLIQGIKFIAVWFYFYPQQRFQSFSEVLNHPVFF